MLFDARGQVAGMQHAVNNGAGWGGSPVGFPLWPGSNIQAQFWHKQKGGATEDEYAMSNYFADPAHLCSAELRAALPAGGIGDRLWTRDKPGCEARRTMDASYEERCK